MNYLEELVGDENPQYVFESIVKCILIEHSFNNLRETGLHEMYCLILSNLYWKDFKI